MKKTPTRQLAMGGFTFAFTALLAATASGAGACVLRDGTDLQGPLCNDAHLCDQQAICVGGGDNAVITSELCIDIAD